MAASNDTKLLMGHQSGALNLTNVKNRAVELRKSVHEVSDALARCAPLHWEDCLMKMSVINQQVMALREQLRGLLKQIVLHPKMVDAPDLAHALPIQLASKPTPEMEAEDSELVRRIEAAGGASISAAGGGAASQTVAMRYYEEISADLDEYNRLLVSLTSGGGVLDPQGPDRKDIERDSRAIVALITVNKEAEAHYQAQRSVGQRLIIPSPGSAAPVVGAQRPTAGGQQQSQQHGAPGLNKPPRVGESGIPPSHSGPLDPALMVLLTGEGLRRV